MTPYYPSYFLPAPVHFLQDHTSLLYSSSFSKCDSSAHFCSLSSSKCVSSHPYICSLSFCKVLQSLSFYSLSLCKLFSSTHFCPAYRHLINVYYHCFTLVHRYSTSVHITALLTVIPQWYCALLLLPCFRHLALCI